MRTLDRSWLYTYADLEKRSEVPGHHDEILEGELTVTPAPVPRHQLVMNRLNVSLSVHVEAGDLGVVHVAPLDVVLDETNVLQPDILFIARAHLSIVGAENVQGPPDLVVEVLSKGTAQRDRVTKRAIYERFGVRHYWIVDPIGNQLEELVLKRRRYTAHGRFSGRSTFEPACFPGLAIPLAKVFA